MSFFSAVVVTVSDRSYRGQRPDEAGPLVAELLREAGYTVVRTALVPDEQSQIAHILEEIADSGTVDLLVTTGGTGFSPRDVTPEATLSVCDRLAPVYRRPCAMPRCKSLPGPCCPGLRPVFGAGR